jgi:hypothetical protein
MCSNIFFNKENILIPKNMMSRAGRDIKNAHNQKKNKGKRPAILISEAAGTSTTKCHTRTAKKVL